MSLMKMFIFVSKCFFIKKYWIVPERKNSTQTKEEYNQPTGQNLPEWYDINSL